MSKFGDVTLDYSNALLQTADRLDEYANGPIPAPEEALSRYEVCFVDWENATMGVLYHVGEESASEVENAERLTFTAILHYGEYFGGPDLGDPHGRIEWWIGLQDRIRVFSSVLQKTAKHAYSPPQKPQFWASRFDLSWDTVKRRIADGSIRAISENEKAVRIHLDDVRSWSKAPR